MHKLVIVRHGLYTTHSDRMGLTPEGKKQIGLLARQIQRAAEGYMTISLLTSSLGRALDSAKIIGEILDVEYQSSKLLRSDDSLYRTDIPAALDLIKAQDPIDMVIVVTHHEYCIGLPPAFGQRFLYMKQVPEAYLDEGEALVVDCDAKTFTKLVPIS